MSIFKKWWSVNILVWKLVKPYNQTAILLTYKSQY